MGHYDNLLNRNGTGRLAGIPSLADTTAEEIYDPALAVHGPSQEEDDFLPLNMNNEPDPSPAPQAVKKQPGKKKKEEKKQLTDPHGGKRKQNADDPPMDKKKFSIYLDAKLSASVRMVYAISGKKFSHLAEDALCDMLYNRYQCRECMTTFSISGSDTIPTICPSCGQKNLARLWIDRLD